MDSYRLVGIVVVAAFVALAVALMEEPPDETVTSRVTSVEAHLICVAAGDQVSTCSQVDAARRLRDIERGDCVRLTVSADEQLVDVVPADACP